MHTHNLVTAMGHSRGGRGLHLPVTLTPEPVAGADAPMMVDNRCSRRRAQNRVCLFVSASKQKQKLVAMCASETTDNSNDSTSNVWNPYMCVCVYDLFIE